MASKRILKTSPEQNSPLAYEEKSGNSKRLKSLTPVDILPSLCRSRAQDDATAKQENELTQTEQSANSEEKVPKTVENSEPVREEWEDNPRVGTDEFLNMLESETNITYNAPKYYKIRSNIGSGSYGSVVLAVDTRSNNMVAIKKLSHPFEHNVYARRTLREIRLAKQVRHRNIIPLLDLFTPHRDWSEFSSAKFKEKEEIYLVMQYGGQSLHNRIRENSLTAAQRTSILYQIISGTEDLKPHNIAVDDNGVAYILDFGLARTSTDNTCKTGYVATRWYRAPELVYGLTLTGSQAGNSPYNAAVDVFSIGAIIAEMELRKPLFYMKDNKILGGVQQLCAVLSLMGRSDDQWLETVITDLFDREHIKQKFQVKPYPELFEMLRPAFPGLSDPDQGVDLMIRMLHVNPSQRLTASEARCHRYFHSFNPGHVERHASVPVPESPLNSPLHHEENSDATAEQLKRAVWMEMRNFQT